MDNTFDRLKYADFIKAERHDDAIAYVDEYRGRFPGNRALRRRAALARGGKGEFILMSCDRSGQRPSQEQIDTMCHLFKEATALDPNLADAYWDLAVIHMRFLNDAAKAAVYLADAKRLGCKHPMMKRLEAMIEAAGMEGSDRSGR